MNQVITEFQRGGLELNGLSCDSIDIFSDFDLYTVWGQACFALPLILYLFNLFI